MHAYFSSWGQRPWRIDTDASWGLSRCKTKSHMPLRFQNHMQSSTEFHMIALLHIFYGSTPMHLFEFLKLWTRTACFKNLHCFALWSYQRWRPICKSERINWPARLGRDGRFLDGDTKNKQTQKKKEHRKGRTNQRHVLYFLFVLSCISYPGMFPRCWMGPKTLRFLKVGEGGGLPSMSLHILKAARKTENCTVGGGKGVWPQTETAFVSLPARTDICPPRQTNWSVA